MCKKVVAKITICFCLHLALSSSCFNYIRVGWFAFLHTFKFLIYFKNKWFIVIPCSSMKCMILTHKKICNEVCVLVVNSTVPSEFENFSNYFSTKLLILNYIFYSNIILQYITYIANFAFSCFVRSIFIIRNFIKLSIVFLVWVFWSIKHLQSLKKIKVTDFLALYFTISLLYTCKKRNV